MYGVIGSALFLGILFTQLVKRKNMKSFFGDKITIVDKDKSFTRYAIGGLLFGLGWGLAGACPGPMYTLLGAGFFPILVVILGALLGTFCYGLFKNNLPH
jgi:uncharacterized membrane protein YedE/YeeE